MLLPSSLSLLLTLLVAGDLCASARSAFATGDGGPATEAALASPTALAVDAAGSLYIADTGHHVVRRVGADGRITTVAGTGEPGDGPDLGGAGTGVALRSPQGVAAGPDGNLYIADTGNHKIRRLSPSGDLRTVFFQDLNFHPHDLAFDRWGALVIADPVSHWIVRLKTGSPSAFQLVVGTGEAGYNGEGALFGQSPLDLGQSLRQLNTPTAIAYDVMGDLWIADSANRRIRKVIELGPAPAAAGTILTLAEVRARVSGLAPDPQEGVYYALAPEARVFTEGEHRVYRLRDQQSAPVAGTGQPGFSGDGGFALAARLNTPRGLATDVQGNLYIADTSNHRVRRVDSNGIITTVAGGFPEPFIEAVVVGLVRDSPQRLAPGALASVHGRFLNPGPSLTGITVLDIARGRVPVKLGGVCVEVNGVRAPVFQVSNERIVFQTPSLKLSPSTSARVRVLVRCDQPDQFATNLVVLPGAEAAPEFLYFRHEPNGVSFVGARDETRRVWSGPRGLLPGITTEPADQGDIVTLYLTGLGDLIPAVAPGSFAPAGATVRLPVLVHLGSVNRIAPISAVASVGYAGVYEVKFQVPFSIAAGNQPVTVQVGGDPANPNTGARTPTGAYLSIE